MQNLNLMFGRPRRRVCCEPSSRSRWVDVPEGVTRSRGRRLPAGFRAAGVAAGIKPSGGLDVGLLVCDSPQTTSAARFTRSGTAAAPVLVTRERCDLAGLRAVAVNSGNANAATGGRGLDEAARMQGAGAMVAGVAENQVAVCSTGVIGVQLPGDKVMRGLLECSKRAGRRGRRRLPAGDHDHRRVREARDDRGRPAGRHRPAGGAGQGRRA